MKLKEINFYGLKISDFSIENLHSYYKYIISESKTAVCYGYSLGIIPFFKKYPQLYKMINSFDVSVTDGTQFYWMMNFFGYKTKTFLSIPFMTIDALQYANKNKKSVLLLGSDNETNKLATNNLRKKYPNIIFYDGHHGYFSQDQEQDLVNYINDCGPNFLLIGISSPKKEEFAFKYKSHLRVNIVIPCGGMIDVFSGKVKLASPFIKKIGLATLVRIIQEPKRQLSLNLWIAFEVIFKIFPKLFWSAYIKNNKNYFLPSIYKIREND